jgi:hypothetical protein
MAQAGAGASPDAPAADPDYVPAASSDIDTRAPLG